MANNNTTKKKPVESDATSAVDRIEGCYICLLNDHQDQILLCERCNGEYHTYCLQPPLQSVPEHDWYCGTFIQQSFCFTDSICSSFQPHHVNLNQLCMLR